MRQYLMNYTQEVEKKLKKNDLGELEVKIAFFQHERLIHLLVTLAFAIFALVFLALGMVSYVFLIIFAILIIFLLFYIVHYFFLENHVQYLYKLYDEMNEKVNKNS